jgi:electron transfer flavoprotein alpha subunit
MSQLVHRSSRLFRPFSGALHSSRCASTLVIGEVSGDSLTGGTLSTITAASKLGNDTTVFVAGKDIKTVADNACKVKGVSKVVALESEVNLEFCMGS